MARKKKIINFWVNETFKMDLKDAATSECITVTEFIKVACYHYMNHIEKQKLKRKAPSGSNRDQNEEREES